MTTMTTDDKKRMAACLAALAATFGRELDQHAYTGFEWGLRGVPIEAVEVAARRALRECRFFPTPHELRVLAGELTPEQRAIRAFEIAVSATKRISSDRSILFDDSAINATIANLGGWPKFHHERFYNRHDFFVWTRKEFERVYLCFSTSGCDEGRGGHLPGRHEMRRAIGDWRDALPPGHPCFVTEEQKNARCRPVRFKTGLPPLLHDSRRQLTHV
ncbi:hypothetical protein [uncultured Mediterranean phage uvDeep-CGR2-KM19-C37]|nr:hypothetical protein [uncultured Mediterranean phage uvDeep-CGR2-KM19-C37]